MPQPLSAQPLSPIVRSALWAAWGDALGFQTELAGNEQQLQRRLGAGRVETTGAWRRRIGGRFGVQIDLPAGTYSDDTQLRLAVSRCIRASGRFDIEAFSKIELSIFPSYGLGAGIGTTTAARALGKRSVRWNSNFFSSSRSTYIDGGGNGAAMRIQPHVWASRELRPGDYLPTVIRDAVITHGHPRGILGAVLHALAVGSVLREDAIPEPSRWTGMVDYLRRVPTMMADDDALAERWIPMWEQQANRSWPSAVLETIDELTQQVQTATTAAQEPGAEAERYADLCEKLGGLQPKTRGSGTLAAILSLWLAWRHQSQPTEGLRIAANLTGSDTDTIATMAGALLGPVTDEALSGPLLDHDLHVREAERLERLRTGADVEDFPHPDPLHWQQPATLSDAVGLIDGKPALMGLGAAEPDGGIRPGKDHTGWQWFVTSFDQHVLVKRREDLAKLPEWSYPRHRSTGKPEQPLASPQQQLVAQPAQPHRDRPKQPQELPAEVEDAVEQVLTAGFKHEIFVQMFLHLTHQPYGSTKAALFASMVAERLRSNKPVAPTTNGTATAPNHDQPSTSQA
jgi:ADP-ribosylglycohydrolase